MYLSPALAFLPALVVAGPLLDGRLGNPTRGIQRRDSWGGAVSLGPTKSRITHAVTTIVPGAAPPTQNGELFLWPGMSNGTGDLIQTTLESWPDNSWCGAATGQWCIRASVFGSFGQLDGVAGVVSGSQAVKIDYSLQSDGTTWLQTATDATTGKVLSTFSHNSGPYMTGYGTGVRIYPSHLLLPCKYSPEVYRPNAMEGALGLWPRRPTATLS